MAGSAPPLLAGEYMQLIDAQKKGGTMVANLYFCLNVALFPTSAPLCFLSYATVVCRRAGRRTDIDQEEWCQFPQPLISHQFVN